MPVIIPNGAGADPLADNVVPDINEVIVNGATVLSSDTKKPFRNDTGASITVTDPSAAGLVADGFTEILEQGIANLAAYIDANGSIKEGIAVTGGAGSLTLNVSAGQFTWIDETTNPDEIKTTAYAAQNAISFDTYDVNGLVAAGQTIVDVQNYDNSGVSTPMAQNNDAQNWTLFADPKTPDTFALLYGQTQETTLGNAENNMASYTPIVPAALSDWLIVARFAARKDADDLGSSTDARFRNANKFGEIAEQAVVAPMTGATDTLDGESGTVPQPVAGDEGKFLRGDGSWQNAGKSRVHADATTVAAADTANPTDAEILAFVTAGTLTDQVVFYTGTDIDTDPITHVYHVDSAGVLTLILSPATVSAMLGATPTTDGEGGTVPKPTAGENTSVLFGDGSWVDLGIFVVGPVDGDQFAIFGDKRPAMYEFLATAPRTLTINDDTSTTSNVHQPCYVWNRPDSSASITIADSTSNGYSGPATLFAGELGIIFWSKDGTMAHMLVASGGGSEMVGADGTTDGQGGTVPAPVSFQNNWNLFGDGTWQKSGFDIQTPIDGNIGTQGNSEYSPTLYEFVTTGPSVLDIQDYIGDLNSSHPLIVWVRGDSANGVSITDSTTNGVDGDLTDLAVGEMAVIYWNEDGNRAIIDRATAATVKTIDQQVISATIPPYAIDATLYDGAYFDLQPGSADIQFSNPLGMTINDYGGIFTYVVANNSGASKNVNFAPQFDDSHGNNIVESVADGDTASFAFVFTQTGFHQINHFGTPHEIEDAAARTILAADFINTRGRNYIRVAGAVDIDAGAFTGVRAGESIAIRNVSGGPITIGDNGLTLNGNLTFEDQEVVIVVVIDASTADVVGGTSA